MHHTPDLNLPASFRVAVAAIHVALILALRHLRLAPILRNDNLIWTYPAIFDIGYGGV
jgi:hypothetical protein